MYRDKKLEIRYFITAFAVAFLSIIIMVAFILSTTLPTEVGGQKVYNNLENQQIYLPSNEDKLSIIMLITSKSEGAPFVATLINIDPVMGYIPVITLPIKLCLEYKENISTLEEIYMQWGGSAVKTALGNLFNTEIDRYIVIDKETLTGVFDISGAIEFNMPISIEIMNNISIKSGLQTIDSLAATEILETACYNLEYKDMSTIVSGILAEGFNNLIKIFSSSQGEQAFNYIVNNSTTDISFIDYTKRVSVAKFFSKLSKKASQNLVTDVYIDDNLNILLQDGYIKLISEMLRDK